MRTEAERMKAKSEKERKEQRRKRSEGFLIKGYQLGELPAVEMVAMIRYTDTGRLITYRSKKHIDWISIDDVVRGRYSYLNGQSNMAAAQQPVIRKQTPRILRTEAHQKTYTGKAQSIP
jgi:hypothetical protein